MMSAAPSNRGRASFLTCVKTGSSPRNKNCSLDRCRANQPVPLDGGRGIETLFHRRVGLVHFTEANGIQTRVNDDAIAETERLTGPDGEAPVAALVVFEVADAEDVGRKESVGARVPVGRMARIRGIVEY